MPMWPQNGDATKPMLLPLTSDVMIVLRMHADQGRDIQ